MKKYALGIGLLVLSGLVLFQNYLPRFDLSIWKMVWLVVLAVGLVNGLVKRRLYDSFFFGTWLFILLNKQYHFLMMDTKTIIVGAILACLGCHILFKPKRGNIRFLGDFKSVASGGKGAMVEDEDSVAFGSSTRYIHDTNFVRDTVDVAFGSTTIYFDNTVMAGEEATFIVDAAFSTVRLYVPDTWLVEVRADKAFSSIQQVSPPIVFDKKLVVKADLAFSTLEIISL
ncbi:hypothetical protein [Streptococcus respiraculi]|uniref:hypothetical protein n=1 Tax=Streptococcus respiraculi TaxID=2021971 RepID=UPI000E756974|nr:hypothetical protein [Streptococcus respiraculi]